MKNKGFLSIILVLSLLPFLVYALDMHSESFSAMGNMKNTLFLQQKINEAVYNAENGFIFAVEEGLKVVAARKAAEKFIPITEVEANGIVCISITAWMLKNSDYSFNFNCLTMWIDTEKVEAKLFTSFFAEMQIHEATAKTEVPQGTVIGL